MFKNAVTIFRVYGIDVRIDPSWLLIAALFVWNLSTQYFPATIPGYSQPVYIALASAAMLGFFGSLLLHELAHSVVAIAYGLKITNITLFIFGGVAGLGSEPKTAKSEFWIAIAGPAMSFALSALGYFLANIFTKIDASIPLIELFAYLGIANLVLAIFNMIPAFPMDGGRVLRAAVWHFKSDFGFATRLASQLGTFMGIGFMGLGIFSMLGGAGIGGFWIILIGFFVYSSSKGAYENQRLTKVLGGHTVGQIMTRTLVTIEPSMPISDLVNGVVLQQNVGFLPVVQDHLLLGYIDRKTLHVVGRENWPTTTVGDIYIPTSPENTVPPNFPTQELVVRMQTGKQRKFLVANGPELVGVLSLSDILSYFALREEFGQ